MVLSVLCVLSVPSLATEDHSDQILAQVRALNALARSGQLSESLAKLAQVEKDLLPTDTARARVSVLMARINAIQREPHTWEQIQTLLDAAERIAEASSDTELRADTLQDRAHTENTEQRYDDALATLQRLRQLPDLRIDLRLSAYATEAATQHYIGQDAAAKKACSTGIAEATGHPLIQAQLRAQLALILQRMDETVEAKLQANAAILTLSEHSADRPSAEALASAHLTRAIMRGTNTDYERAVQLYEQLDGKDARALIPALTSQGYHLLTRNDLDAAERVLERGLALAQQHRLPPFEQLILMENLTLLRLKQKRPEEAKVLAAQMRDVWSNWVPLVLEAGSEAERLNLLLQSHWLDTAIAAGDDAKSIEAILATYGSVFDSLMRDAALAARLPRDQRQHYKQSQAKLAALALHGDASAAAEEVSRLRRLIQSMAAPVAGVFDPGGGGRSQPAETPFPIPANKREGQTKSTGSGVTDPGYSQTTALRAALPADSALIVFATYRSLDIKPTRRLAAAVITREAEHLIILPASADAIRSVGDTLIESLKPPAKTEQAQQHLRDLHTALLTPLQPALGKATHLYLCLDGSMNRVPATLWTLPISNLRSQISDLRSQATFLTSPRALLRKAPKQAPTNNAWLIANTGHAPLKFPIDAAFPYNIANHFADHTLRALPGTDTEVSTLVEANPERWFILRAQLGGQTETDPNESSLVQALADPPAVLHIAGHAAHSGHETAATQASQWWQGMEQPNALWTSCLFFPQPDPATNLDDASNDNYLFAAEIVGLDLAGTKLVTLSACETGTGLSPLSEGSYSLARAFHSAGARDVLSCTEPLPDAAVTDLMKPFYDRLAKGEDPAEAFWTEQQSAIGDDLKKLRAFGFFRLTRAWVK